VNPFPVAVAAFHQRLASSDPLAGSLARSGKAVKASAF